MPIANPQDANFISSIPIDKILGTYTGTMNVAAPTSGSNPKETIVNIPTNINETTFFQGIFSWDNGVTWNDFNSQTPDYTGGYYGPQTCDMFALSQSGNLKLVGQSWFNYNTSTGIARTILYKVAIIAKPNTGSVTPQPLGAQTEFNSNYNYQKIYKDEYIDGTFGTYPGVLNFDFTHNLGYVPMVRIFIEFKTSGAYAPTAGFGLYDMGHIISSDAYSPAKVDVQKTRVTLDWTSNPYSSDIRVYCRTYYDR
jgi:hypothetical protein